MLVAASMARRRGEGGREGGRDAGGWHEREGDERRKRTCREGIYWDLGEVSLDPNWEG